jgi:DNA modification methylase
MFMQGMKAFIGENDMLAYLAMMAPRLLQLRRVLKPTGSIYLHCDPTASHYLKLLMDAVFGGGNFRNEIIWCYKRWPSKQDNFQQMHDVIFRYSKSKDVLWNKLYEDFTEQTKRRIKGGMKIEHVLGESGKILIRPTKEKSPGVAMCDYWNIPMIAGQAKERLGYPTQKPEALLERIILASSNEGDVVLDAFCGCGTTIAVAQRLGRRWIGIDITHLAISLIKHRLQDTFGDAIAETYQTIGAPTSLPDAETLAAEDPYQFQWWALELVGARPVEQKKGSDKGIDGRLYFHDEGEAGKTKQVVLSVKAGGTGVAHVRDLRGVLDREQAEIGVLITMQEPTRTMRTEAASAGFYDSPWGTRHPKLQILTVAQLLAGKGIDMPPIRQVSKTFKKAPRAKGKDAPTPPLPFGQEERQGGDDAVPEREP